MKYQGGAQYFSANFLSDDHEDSQTYNNNKELFILIVEMTARGHEELLTFDFSTSSDLIDSASFTLLCASMSLAWGIEETKVC